MEVYLKMGLNTMKLQEARMEESSTIYLGELRAKDSWLHLHVLLMMTPHGSLIVENQDI